MLPDTFRLLALGLEKTRLTTVFGRERWFAGLASADPTRAELRLSREDQARFVAADRPSIAVAPGSAGARGVTLVRLATVEEAVLRQALAAAHRRAISRV